MAIDNKIKEEDRFKIYLTAMGYASLALVIVFIIFIDVPDALLYARKGAMRWLPFLLIFGAFPYSVFKTLQLFYPKYSFLIAVGMLLVIGPLFGIQLNRFDKLALDRDGEIVEGSISKKYQFKPSNRDPEWLIQGSFQVKGQEFSTFPIQDKNDEFVEGTSLDIIYSARNPAINMFYFDYKTANE